MNEPSPSEPTLRCGKCGVALSLAQADLAADGYRCLSCSTDETLAAGAAERARDEGRIFALKMLRISVLSVPLLLVLVGYAEGATRWGAIAASVALGVFTVINVRRLLR